MQTDIKDRTLKFGVGIIKLCMEFAKTPVTFAITSQLVRSGTSVGANMEEAQDAMLRADF